MSKTPSLKFNVVHSVTTPKAPPNFDTTAPHCKLPKPNIVGHASHPAPMAKGDDGKPRPANRPASEGL